MRVYLDEHGGSSFDPRPAIYVEREAGHGALDEIHEEAHGWAYTLPERAVELHTADGAVVEVLDRVRHALSAVKMSATARREVERALDDLDPGDG